MLYVSTAAYLAAISIVQSSVIDNWIQPLCLHIQNRQRFQAHVLFRRRVWLFQLQTEIHVLPVYLSTIVEFRISLTWGNILLCAIQLAVLK